MSSRRKFITGSIGAVAGALATSSSRAVETTVQSCATEVASLCGEWLFRTDPEDLGTQHNWYGVDVPGEGWRTVLVPDTWQVETPLADYRGAAWYWRAFDLPGGGACANWGECAVRVEFEAVPAPQVLGPKAPGKIRVGVAPPDAQLGQGNAAGADYSTPIRNVEVALMSGPAVEIAALESHVPMQLQAEAQQKQCDYIMYSGVIVKHSSGGGFGKFMKIGQTAASLNPP